MAAIESDALTDPYPVALDRFQDPLDLPLHRIRKQDIDIFDIPIAQVAQQFPHALQRTEPLQLERAGEVPLGAVDLARIDPALDEEQVEWAIRELRLEYQRHGHTFDVVEVIGRGEGLGRPLPYGTTRHFLEHFGFRSLSDLPRPEDLPVVPSATPAMLPDAA